MLTVRDYFHEQLKGKSCNITVNACQNKHLFFCFQLFYFLFNMLLQIIDEKDLS